MARADDFLLTAEELRLRRQKRLRIALLLALLVVLGAAGYFGARPASNAVKGWQSRRHAQKAFAFIEQEKWSEARAAAVAAYQLRPSEPEALRAVARFLSRTRQPQALEFWTRLAEVQPLAGEDRRDEAAVAMLGGDMTRAETAIAELTNRNPTPADWLLAAQLALQKSATADAHPALAKIFENPAASEREQLQAALLELGILAARTPSADLAPRIREAWARVEKLSAGHNAVALDALVTLARQILSRPAGDPTLSTATAASVSEALQAHPLAGAPQKLLALDLLGHEDPSRKADLIGRAIAEWKTGDPPARAALATWLNSKGEYQRHLDSIPLDQALQTRDLFLQHLDALGALGRWSDIKELLEAERFPIDPVVQRMYLARCNAQLGQKAAAENNWQRALEAAGGDAGKLMTVAQYAEKNGAAEVAANAYHTAIMGAAGLRPAHQGRLRLAQASGDTRKIHAALADMLKIWKNDPAVQNDEAYMRLLLLPSVPSGVDAGVSPADNEELRQIEVLAAQLVERNPASLPHRTLLALARLKQSRPADALAVYSNIEVAQNALTPSALAVHAAALAANGQTEAARSEAAQISAERLVAEEEALIAALR